MDSDIMITSLNRLQDQTMYLCPSITQNWLASHLIVFIVEYVDTETMRYHNILF